MYYLYEITWSLVLASGMIFIERTALSLALCIDLLAEDLGWILHVLVDRLPVGFLVAVMNSTVSGKLI